jgi:hypothetical protein
MPVPYLRRLTGSSRNQTANGSSPTSSPLSQARPTQEGMWR